MKYSASIIWIHSKHNIFLTNSDETMRRDINLTPAIIQFSEKNILMQFNWDDYGYSVSFRLIKENIYEGIIISQHEELGTAVLHLYQFQQKYLCRVEWHEDSDEADCFIITKEAL